MDELSSKVVSTAQACEPTESPRRETVDARPVLCHHRRTHALKLARPSQCAGPARSRPRLYRKAVLGAATVYFVAPLIASARFSFEGDHGSLSLSGYTSALGSHEFWSSLSLSVEVGLGAVALELVLMLGTSLWVYLHAPKWRLFVETLTLVPIVVPVVVLVLGVSGTLRFLPSFIVFTPVILALEYVVLAMPYAYRIIDSGVRSINLSTMVDAGRSLGANWFRVIFTVLLPNLKGALLGAGFMTFGLVLGEYVMASLLSFNTFPVWLETVGVVHATEAVALSVLSLLGTVVVLGAVAIVGSARAKDRLGERGHDKAQGVSTVPVGADKR